jgi:hypothetical protein
MGRDGDAAGLVHELESGLYAGGCGGFEPSPPLALVDSDVAEDAGDTSRHVPGRREDGEQVHVTHRDLGPGEQGEPAGQMVLAGPGELELTHVSQTVVGAAQPLGSALRMLGTRAAIHGRAHRAAGLEPVPCERQALEHPPAHLGPGAARVTEIDVPAIVDPLQRTVPGPQLRQPRHDVAGVVVVGERHDLEPLEVAAHYELLGKDEAGEVARDIAQRAVERLAQSHGIVVG